MLSLHAAQLKVSLKFMIITQIKHKFSSKFIRNVGWLGGAEIINRIFRLGSTFTIARTFSPNDYGLVAIVMTTLEFSNVFIARAGISSKLVQAAEEDLDVLCETAYWMSWLTSIGIFLFQCAASVPIAWFYRDSRIILPVCLLAATYLLSPLMTVQLSMLDRANRLNVIALCNATQTFCVSVLTVIFILLGFGMWSVILPLLLTSPIWPIICRINHPWRPKSSFTLERWREIARYAINYVGTDLLAKLRDNLDYLLVGRFLGLEALGIYYFAFNAGLGISMSVINSVTWSLWPHLCAARDQSQEFKQRYFSGLKTISATVIPLVLLQSGLAPFYVPLIFGAKWIDAVPILITVCLSAIPRPFFIAASQLLNAIDKTHISLGWSLGFTLVYGLALLIGVNHGILSVAIAVLISQFLITPLFAVWATRYAFKSSIVGSHLS
jgi:O-antigen/teichoic acid export membrane protein